MGGSEKLQNVLTDLITEHDNTFSYSVKGRSIDVPPMEFSVDEKIGRVVATEWHRDRFQLKNR